MKAVAPKRRLVLLEAAWFRKKATPDLTSWTLGSGLEKGLGETQVIGFETALITCSLHLFLTQVASRSSAFLIRMRPF